MEPAAYLRMLIGLTIADTVLTGPPTTLAPASYLHGVCVWYTECDTEDAIASDQLAATLIMIATDCMRETGLRHRL